MFKVLVNSTIEVAIAATRPHQHAQTTYKGDEDGRFADWIPLEYGVRGKRVGDDASPLDLVAALTKSKLKWEIIEGAEILDLPITELPKGAVS